MLDMPKSKVPVKKPWARFFVIMPKETDDLKLSQLEAREQLFPKKKRYNQVSSTKNIMVK